MSIISSLNKHLIFGLSLSFQYLQDEHDPEKSNRFIYSRILTYISLMIGGHLVFIYSFIGSVITINSSNDFGMLYFISILLSVLTSTYIAKILKSKYSLFYYENVVIKVQNRINREIRKKLIKNASILFMLNGLLFLAIELPLSIYFFRLLH